MNYTFNVNITTSNKLGIITYCIHVFHLNFVIEAKLEDNRL